MPVLRRPLRERRNVNLEVVTSPTKQQQQERKADSKLHASSHKRASSSSHYSKAKASVRGSRRSRHAHHATANTSELSISSIDEIEAQIKALQEAHQAELEAVKRDFLGLVDIDIDAETDFESLDMFSTPRSSTPVQGYHTSSSSPSSPTLYQDSSFSKDEDSFFEVEDPALALAYQDSSFYSVDGEYEGEEDLQSLHEFLPFLFIAFSDGQYTPTSLKASYGVDFTHIIKIAHPVVGGKFSTIPGSISTSVNRKLGTQTMTLTIPSPSTFSPGHKRTYSIGRKQGRRHARVGFTQRMHTLLTEEQLLAVRDFLSLALPYYVEARPSSKKHSAEQVAVLITAPGSPKRQQQYGSDDYDFDGYGNGYGNNNNSNNIPEKISDHGGAADVISAISCYLSFASETPVDTVLAYIDEEEGLGDEWKDAVSRDEEGAGFVEKVAAQVGL
ncbi:hypothetical protein AMATHDRAFT_51498 [Amanita thiersii Skay4041]|uniref:Uncharacterized protein n=1 Tax=Amanita thiersii Skay4041 TaxID=703135 RepID=A0A2A9N944_9AGAR|nr:hypothetical protein AMATHDRAFT_51498 [Amanita thiersii Skay4041]